MDIGVDEAVRRERRQDRPKLWNAFVRGHANDGPVPFPEETEPVMDAALCFVARTKVPPSLIPLKNLLDIEERLNPPRTVTSIQLALPPAESSREVLQQELVVRRIELIALERPRR